MKIKTDLLKVSAVPGLEPEEQAVARVVTGAAPVSGSLTGPTNMGIASEIIVERNANVFAKEMARLCGLCRNFDNLEFVKWVRRSEFGSAESIHAVNEVRAALLTTSNAVIGEMSTGMDGDMDVEHALGICGFCKALTEVHNEPIVVHPASSCPIETVTPDRPHGFFKAKDKSSQRAASAQYDAILNAAAGKIT